jgi:hypothetical protein
MNARRVKTGCRGISFADSPVPQEDALFNRQLRPSFKAQL